MVKSGKILIAVRHVEQFENNISKTTEVGKMSVQRYVDCVTKHPVYQTIFNEKYSIL